MAIYSWRTSIDKGTLHEAFSSALQTVGLEVCDTALGDKQLFAIENSKHWHGRTSNVNVLVFRINNQSTHCEIEVRSSEPMLKRNTRCEELAQKLKLLSPPL